jgi:hypothetical protein
MKNPYEHDWLEDQVRVGRTGQWIALVVFLLFLVLPASSLLVPALRPKTTVVTATSLKDRLTAWEQSAKTLPLLEQWRRNDQARVTGSLGTGNAKVFAGENGWLYYRPDLESITGKGPEHLEPPSVAREKSAKAWQPPLPVIRDFAEQLAARNIRLVFVPVPTKPMVCREGLGLEVGTSIPPAWSQVANDLAAAGIGFVDLFPVIESRGPDHERFLKQDTHWTPGTMAAAAREVAAKVSPGMDRAVPRFETIQRGGLGDLVGMLDFEGGETSVFAPEEVALEKVSNPPSGDGGEVILLGDSFVNVFEDPALGFGEDGETTIGAGFASHFAAALGRPVQTLAIKGGGATAVREAFARLPAKRLAEVKTVVWVLSSRDVLLPEIPARRAGIEWRVVTLPKAETSTAVPTETAARELVGTLIERSNLEDPTQTPYAEAVFSTVFKADDGSDHFVFFWGFRKRQLEPAAALEPGRRYRLRITPFEENAAANRATRLDDLFRPDLVPVFAESFEPLP